MVVFFNTSLKTDDFGTNEFDRTTGERDDALDDDDETTFIGTPAVGVHMWEAPHENMPFTGIPKTTRFADRHKTTLFAETPGTSSAGVPMWEASPETPAWAGGTDIPAGIFMDELAPPDKTESLIKRWESKVSKHSIKAMLEFRSTIRGDLWLKWHNRLKLLTFKNDAIRFLGASSLNRYGVLLARALGVFEDRSQLPQQMVKTLQSTDETLAKTAATIETIKLSEIPRVATDAIRAMEISESEIDGTMNNLPLNLRELR